ncbi:hypothetical protein O1R50_16350 [Glycomyces luteolus]|uniref:Uncharacterized protein n=1 Tax=Glycomyces luteolus TaxID=2670330 RepID=A0A9X3PEN0_9ACTN|nr:hypothetical protein [Glycomyces luteolus]MDA1361204.1 hypothetical protein [Glycomyces luteolus]
MSRLRNAPLEVRRAYQRALAALPAKSTVVFPPRLDALTTVGGVMIDDRALVFGVHGGHPRLWITTDSPEGPNLLGHFSGLVNEAPDLWICDHEAWPWVLSGDIAAQIEVAAERAWRDCIRNCDG